MTLSVGQCESANDHTAVTVSPVSPLVSCPATDTCWLLTSFSCHTVTPTSTSQPVVQQTTTTEVKPASMSERNKEADMRSTTEICTKVLSGVSPNVATHVTRERLTKERVYTTTKDFIVGTTQEAHKSTPEEDTALTGKVPVKEVTLKTQTFITDTGRIGDSKLSVQTNQETQASSVPRDSDRTGVVPVRGASRLTRGAEDGVWSRMELTAGQYIRQTAVRQSAQCSPRVRSGGTDGQSPCGHTAPPCLAPDQCPVSSSQ
ncbi:hypothetical protein ACOMHN_012661 [Nucella lapillus]